LREAAERLAGAGGKVETLVVDVADDDAGERMVARCVQAFGSVDILVNNAGIFPQAPVLEMAAGFLDRVYRVNLRGLALASKAAGRRMVAQGHGGTIVNIASVDALHPSMVGLAAYDASKGGVLMFTRSFALEMAPHGVRVNAIAPGGVRTEGTSRPLPGSGMTAEQAERFQAEFVRAKVPLGRMGDPDDIATVVVFLASPASGYMTGELVVVDGGMLLT
jgi:2-deoxy-D-gluconate 3-dehydrogenase